MTDTRTPLSPDQYAAHEFLSELRTRISTQPLPYQYGVEARVLESLWALFGQARAAMTKYPGCGRFADAVTQMLNVELRPLTAKWDRAHMEGRLHPRAEEPRGSQDGAQGRAAIGRRGHSGGSGYPVLCVLVFRRPINIGYPHSRWHCDLFRRGRNPAS